MHFLAHAILENITLDNSLLIMMGIIIRYAYNYLGQQHSV